MDSFTEVLKWTDHTKSYKETQNMNRIFKQESQSLAKDLKKNVGNIFWCLNVTEVHGLDVRTWMLRRHNKIRVKSSVQLHELAGCDKSLIFTARQARLHSLHLV